MLTTIVLPCVRTTTCANLSSLYFFRQKGTDPALGVKRQEKQDTVFPIPQTLEEKKEE